MKTDPNDFDELRILLAWKRHEQPPPCYFADFSDGIMAHLRDRTESDFMPWWEKWLDWFDARPVLVGAYGVAVCGLLITGVTLRQVREETEESALHESPAFTLSAASESAVASNHFLLPATLLGVETLSSTLPIMSYSQDGFGPRAYDWHLAPASLNYR